jgi:endonuclease-3
MKRQQIAKKIQKILTELYPDPKPSLNALNDYTFLIAVMLSANARDAVVNKVTPQLFSKASTPEQMIQLSVEEIEKIIRPCGLGPQKARALWAMSSLLIDRFKGVVPKTFEDLESLPGVGHKTASVMMCQVFGQSAFPVDTHIHRCAQRWGLSAGKNVKQTEKDLKELFPEKEWAKIHLQIIYFAREHCPATGHNSTLCPVCSLLIPIQK